ncbi:MAG TPA: hypothetical protein H9898_06195 [Candidatus Anaerobiospirillum stercoravium]|nr:hypothetical protein [Candidatus Anaerobiospirillum stercoravium]
MYDQSQLYELELPRLSVSRYQRKDGSYRTNILAQGKLIGHIEGEFGLISFRPDFVEQYPQLEDQEIFLDEDQGFCFEPSDAAAQDEAADNCAEDDDLFDQSQLAAFGLPRFDVVYDEYAFYEPCIKFQLAGNTVGTMDCIDTPAEFEPKFEQQYPQLKTKSIILDEHDRFTVVNKILQPKKVGVTLLLANIAHTSGLEQSLAQASSPQEAQELLQLATLLSQAKQLDLSRLKWLGRDTFWGPTAQHLTTDQITAQFKRAAALQQSERFYQELLKVRLSADLASGNFRPFAFWGQRQDHSTNLLFLSDFDSGELYYCGYNEIEPIKPEHYAQCKERLEHFIRTVLAQLPQGSAIGADDPLPWALVAIFADTSKTDSGIKQALKLGLNCNIKVSRQNKRFESYLEYGYQNNLASAREITWGEKRVRTMQLPLDLCPRVLNSKRKPYELSFYLYGDFSIYDQYYDHLFAEVQKSAQKLRRGSARYTESHIVDRLVIYDQDKKCWAVNPARCDEVTQNELTWVQGSTLPISAQAIMNSFAHADLCRNFLSAHEFAPIYNWFNEAPSVDHNGKLMVQLYALSLFLALRARAQAACHGAFGRRPNAEEQKLLTNTDELLRHLRSIEGHWDGSKLTITKLSDEQKELLALLGFELKPNADGKLCSSWEEWCQLGSATN